MRPALTPELARAAATDAGYRHMRRAGRVAWNEDDYNAAVREYDRLMPCLPRGATRAQAEETVMADPNWEETLGEVEVERALGEERAPPQCTCPWCGAAVALAPNYVSPTTRDLRGRCECGASVLVMSHPRSVEEGGG